MRAFPALLNEDGTLKWLGLATGRTTLLDEDEELGLVALKIDGHRYWSSLMQPQAYAPAKYVVCEGHRSNVKRTDGRARFNIHIITPVMEWPARKRK